MARIIVCECGTTVRGDSDRELLAGGRRHMESNHPAVAEQITDDELLALSEEERANNSAGREARVPQAS